MTYKELEEEIKVLKGKIATTEKNITELKNI